MLDNTQCHRPSVTLRTPTAPQSVSQCHLDITLGLTGSPFPHPQGTIARAAAPCQGCFLLLCSKSSATACSFKDFLLSGPASGLAQPGIHSPKPMSWPAGTLGTSAPTQSHRACAGSSGPCPTPRVPRPVRTRRGTLEQPGRT